jgi:predicted Zn-dependent protease
MKEKIKAETQDFCKRLGEYRQHFAWSALQVFDQKGNLLLQKETCFDRIYSWTSKDDIFLSLQSNNNNNNNNNNINTSGDSKVRIYDSFSHYHNCK